MATVLALAKALDLKGDISIATTKYIMEDTTANFRQIVEATGRPYFYADPGLESSKIPGLQVYAQGYVKEGWAWAEPAFWPGFMDSLSSSWSVRPTGY